MTMNRLDARARLVFHYAREEADRLGHAVIESEHLLLGLLREGGTAAVVLNESGLTLEAARHRVVELIGRFERSRDAPPPAITALARRVMDLAGVEAANYQSSYINTGFVLLGMIHAGDGVAMGIINQTAGGTKAVRKATLAALQLPPDVGTDIEEDSSSSSLSGIVAVPADSVLSRLFQRAPEPLTLEISVLPEPVIAQAVPDSSTLNDLPEPVIIQAVPQPMIVQAVPEPVATPLEERDEEIPDSMLIDEAFEEVPPESESEIMDMQMVESIVQIPVIDAIDQIPVVETVIQAPVIETIMQTSVVETMTPTPVVETMTPTPVIEQNTHTAIVEAEPPIPELKAEPIPEVEDKTLTSEIEILATVKHPTPVIDIEPNEFPTSFSELAMSENDFEPSDPSVKATAEVLVTEVEVMPEAILLPEPSVEPVLTDSTDGLLISDLLETPFDQDTNLVLYQTPVLSVLSESQLNLEPPEVQNLSFEDSSHDSSLNDLNQTNDVILLESLETKAPTIAMLEPERAIEKPEQLPVIEDSELKDRILESFTQELSVTEPLKTLQPEPLTVLQIKATGIEIKEADNKSEDLTPADSDFTSNITDSQQEIDTREPVMGIPIIKSLSEAPIIQTDVTPRLKVASWDMVTASSVVKRQIIALGGGGFSDESSNLLLDQYILELASSAREVAVPRVCFVSTAAGDSDVYIKRFYKAFEQLNCQATHLPLFHTDDWSEDLEDMILSADVLYFSGGSTKNALALWQAWELEPIFKQAYEAGTVFTGVSAGAICWFEQFTTDSMGRSLGVMNGLGWLPGSFTPHYDSERFRKPILEKFLRAQKITPGFAADDNAAIHFVNGEYIGAVASVPTAKAYHVTLGRNRLVESPLETRFLGEK
jgi:dipeptidase E